MYQFSNKLQRLSSHPSKRLLIPLLLAVLCIFPAIILFHLSQPIYEYGQAPQLTKNLIKKSSLQQVDVTGNQDCTKLSSTEIRSANKWDNSNIIFTVAGAYVTALTIFLAAVTYISGAMTEKKNRENIAHNELNERYVSFLALTLENNDLAVQDFSYQNHESIYLSGHSQNNIKKEKRQIIIYEILTSLLERAFVVYRDQDSDFKKRQWNGWHSYTIEWFSRSDYSRIWQEYIQCHDYDSDFNIFMLESRFLGKLLAIQDIDDHASNSADSQLSGEQIEQLGLWCEDVEEHQGDKWALLIEYEKIRLKSQNFTQKIKKYYELLPSNNTSYYL